MEEGITVDGGLCSNIPTKSSDIQLVPATDPLELPDTFETCEGSPRKRKGDSLGTSSELESQHLNAICLNIRVAIIRCFYSSSNCPTTALQRLKEEDSELCVTVNIEDINFFVQKFEKTGSVIGSNIDSPLETDDIVNTHSIVETVFDDPAENNAEVADKKSGEMDSFTHTVFFPIGNASEGIEQPPQKQGKKTRSKAPLLRKRKTKASTSRTREALQKPQPKKKSEKKKDTQTQVVKNVRGKKMIQRFPRLAKNQCRICKKKCPDVPSFTYHFLNHFNMTFLPNDGPYKCPGCHKSFPVKGLLHGHLFRRCYFEKFDFSKNKKNPDSTHNLSVTPNSSLSDTTKEDDCLSSEQSSSQTHLEQIEHEANKNTCPSQDPKKECHKCPRCPEILPDMRSLTYHVIDHFNLDHLNGDPPYKCPGGCDQLFLKKDYLYKHLVVTCHKGKKRPETPFNCHLCSKAFHFEIQLEHHLLVHAGKAKLKECNFCGKKFNTTAGFRHHLVSWHAESDRYQCDQCPRYFPRLKLLEEHKLSHSGTYIYMCEICGKNCDNSTSFSAHLKRHTEKPELWKCELCGKYYSSKHYRQHMRTHTQEIVAVCDLCGKGFNHKGNLKIHYKSCQRQMLGANQGNGARKKFSSSGSGSGVNLHASDSGSVNLHGNEPQASNSQSCDSESVNLHNRDSGALNLHSRDSGAINLHGRESGALNLQNRDSGALNLQNRDSGALNLHGLNSNSGGVNLHGFGSGAVNLHGLGSGAVNLHGLGSGSAASQQASLWFKYNQQWS